MPDTRPTSTAMTKARQNEAIAPQNMISPMNEKPYASSSSPRSVVPWKEVCSSVFSSALLGFSRAAVLIFA